MNGSAPKEPTTGSQSCRKRKLVAPAASAGRATCTSSSTMRPTTTSTAPPIATRSPLQTRSPTCAPSGSRGERKGARAVSAGAATSAGGDKRHRLSLDGQAAEGRLDLRHHRLRQGRVVEARGGRLALVDGPPQEAQHRLTLLRIGLVLVDEQVGEGGDGIGVLALRVGDGDAIVGGHLHARGGG